MAFRWKIFGQTLVALLIASVSSSQHASGASKTPCPEYFANMAKAADRDILAEKNIQEMEAVLRDTRLTQAEAVDKAFLIYVDARLKDLPSEIQEPLRALVRERLTVKESNGQLLGSHYNPIKKSITVTGPKGFSETVATLGARAHEFEHALNDEFHIQLYGKSSVTSHWSIKWSKNRFNDELAAMRAEWNILQGVPIELREQMAEAVAADKKVPNYLKKFMERELMNSKLSRSEYIAAEHDAGRYSMNSLKIEDAMAKTTLVSLMGLMGIAGPGTIATQYCILKLHDKRFDRRTEWFRKICLPNLFVYYELQKEQSNY